MPGAQDLVTTSGSLGCADGITASPGSLSASAGTDYATPVGYGGPWLQLQGDFSVIATLASSAPANVFLTLVGAPNSGAEWWQGLKRIDAGINTATYWTGDSATSVNVPYSTTASGTFTVEVARIGGQVAINLNGVQTASFADPGLFTSGRAFFGFNIAPNTTLSVTALAATMPEGGASTLYTPDLQVAARSGTGLRDLAAPENLLMGAAVNPSYFNDSNYLQTIGREYALAVAENAFKFGETEPAAHVFNFCAADQVVAYAKANGMRVRGHNLVWSQDLPDWLTNGDYNPQQAQSILQEHITTVLNHFQGQAIDWDVVNEALSYSPPYDLMSSYWLTQLGPDYVAEAYQWAHEADPSMKLFYNDAGGEGLGDKSDAIYNLVKGLVQAGVPLDGVGLEMHIDVPTAPSQADISANMARLAALGLEVHVSEMDVRLPVDSDGVADRLDLASQATVYAGVMNACRANANCTEFLTWGVTDAYSWIPSSYPGYGAALPFDAQYEPKPAYMALSSALSSSAGVAQTPIIGTDGIVIHGGVAAVVSPGSLVDIYGTNLSGDATLSIGLPLLTTLGGTQVLVNGAPAPLIYVSPGQVIFQLPYSAAAGPVLVQVSSNGIPSLAAAITVQAAAPSILTYGNNLAVVQNQDYTVNSPTNCAAPGSYLIVYLIGSGPLNNPVATGAPAVSNPLSSEALSTTATIGGVPATVTFAGLTPGDVGLVQVNLKVPQVSGNLPLQITVGTYASNMPSVCVR